MTSGEFTSFLERAFKNLAAHSANGSIHFICMDWRHLAEVTVAANEVFGELKNLCVWVKDNAGMGTFYRSRHELVFVFKKGAAPHINNFELGQHGRYRTNVWQYKGVNTLRAGRLDELSLHPTVKPVAMIVDVIKDVSKRNGIVLDPFGGSGSTLIAAHKTGRRGYLAELDPIYVDCIIRRWQLYAKDDAILSSSGETFDSVSLRRKEESAGINFSSERKIDARRIVGRSDAVKKRRGHTPKASLSAGQRTDDTDNGYPAKPIATGGHQDGR